MLNWLRRKRLSPDTRKRLLLVGARAEEAIVETHVSNLLDLLDAVGDEVDLARAIQLYSDLVSLDEARASVVTNRLLARLESPATRAAAHGARYRNVFRDDVRR